MDTETKSKEIMEFGTFDVVSFFFQNFLCSTVSFDEVSDCLLLHHCGPLRAWPVYILFSGVHKTQCLILSSLVKDLLIRCCSSLGIT